MLCKKLYEIKTQSSTNSHVYVLFHTWYPTLTFIIYFLNCGALAVWIRMIKWIYGELYFAIKGKIKGLYEEKNVNTQTIALYGSMLLLAGILYHFYCCYSAQRVRFSFHHHHHQICLMLMILMKAKGCGLHEAGDGVVVCILIVFNAGHHISTWLNLHSLPLFTAHVQLRLGWWPLRWWRCRCTLSLHALGPAPGSLCLSSLEGKGGGGGEHPQAACS